MLNRKEHFGFKTHLCVISKMSNIYKKNCRTEGIPHEMFYHDSQCLHTLTLAQYFDCLSYACIFKKQKSSNSFKNKTDFFPKKIDFILQQYIYL